MTKEVIDVENPKTPADRRKADLAAIHIAKKELCLDDDNYRFILHNICGVQSSAQLDFMGRQKLLMHFRSLGWNPGKPGDEKKPPRARKKVEGQASKVWALWFQLHELGEVKNKSAAALNAFVKRMTQVERVEWLTAEQANVVIEALKKWQRRAEHERS